MKKIALLVTTLALGLTACGGGSNSGTTTPTATATQYQGVWLWMTMNSNQQITRSGLVVLSGEDTTTYGKYGNGGYGEYSVPGDVKSTLTAKGAARLGKLTGASQIQARLFDNTLQRYDILADDDDGVWDKLSDGSLFFYDDDAQIMTDSTNYYNIPFGLTQLTDKVPTGSAQIKALSLKVKQLSNNYNAKVKTSVTSAATNKIALEKAFAAVGKIELK